jgi:hypothetical protein
MSGELNLSDLKKIAKDLTDSINLIRSEAYAALGDRRITTKDFFEIKDCWGELETCELKLQAKIADLELEYILTTDSSQSRSHIEKATSALKSASSRIENVGNVISEIANVINIFSKLVLTIGTGGVFKFPA